MALVGLEHIAKSYGGGAPILSDVSLTLEPGSFCFLTGDSGAGKTTLLRIICLAEPPSRGKLTLFGADSARLDRMARTALRRRIGIVFQDCRLLDELTARDNIALPLRIQGAAEDKILDNVSELLAWVGLADRGDVRAASLSGGERRRVAIARAIVGRPELLIADEPVGDVDDGVALLLVRAFEEINRLGATVLIATRDIGFAGRFEHQRFRLDRGMLSEAGGTAVQ